MTKLIVVCRATGTLGGSTTRRLLKEGWRVRALTRDTTSEKAQALKSAGAELYEQSDYDSVADLKTTFKDANAIFSVTNPFPKLFELGQQGMADWEYGQLMNIATAASTVPGLEHFIMHALPSGMKLAKTSVPHMDAKDRAAEAIKAQLPELAKRTTFMWLGIFPSNFWTYPMTKPVELPGSRGACCYIQPCPASSIIYSAGDIESNVGTFVSAILRHPEISLPAQYAFLWTEKVRFGDLLQAWKDVTGRRAAFIECGMLEYEQLWGLGGLEIGTMWDVLSKAPDWTVGHEGKVLIAADLHISSDDLVGLKASLAANKHLL